MWLSEKAAGLQETQNQVKGKEGIGSGRSGPNLFWFVLISELVLVFMIGLETRFSSRAKALEVSLHTLPKFLVIIIAVLYVLSFMCIIPISFLQWCCEGVPFNVGDETKAPRCETTCLRSPGLLVRLGFELESMPLTPAHAALNPPPQPLTGQRVQGRQNIYF